MSKNFPTAYPLEDRVGCIRLIDHMGSDLSIVNNARASFDKYKDVMDLSDEKLIRYCAKHEHWSPFRSVVFSFQVKAPLFIARQWWKHVVASSHVDEQIQWNERSLRYDPVDDVHGFYIPDLFREQSTDNRQSSYGALTGDDHEEALLTYQAAVEASFVAYRKLLDLGVCREQARGVLVPSVYVSWTWTVSLQALINFLRLRTGTGAQGEIQRYATAIIPMIKPVCPVAIDALMG